MTPTPLQSSRLAALPGVRHAFFTRQGGASQGLYEGLNVGIGSGDDPAAVTENRRRAAAWFAAPAAALVTAYQIHSATALTVDGPWPGERPKGDAVVTATPGVICGALSADCAPVLIADAEAGVAASVHAGWRGALGGVVAGAVTAMQALGARPERMVAAVGPCIGPLSYEVGPEFLDAFTAEAAENARFFQAGAAPDKRMFDLPAFVLEQLRRAGVADAEWTGHDTCADEARFFSNRRAVHRGEPDYGRLLSAIMLTAG
jgi:YfiH family protein